jgi:cytochrome d ubiquinol oxidase subunit I
MVHVSFQVMVAIGFGLLALALWFFGWMWVRRRVPDSRLLLVLVTMSGFAGFIAVEAGWMVTELGRQPWIIYGIVRTSQAITPAPGLVVSFLASVAIYIGLAVALVLLLLRQASGTRRQEAKDAGSRP